MVFLLRLVGFWNELAGTPDEARLRGVLSEVLRDAAIARGATEVEVRSVSGPPMEASERRPGVLHVHFSGESFHHDLGPYDLALVAGAPTTAKVVPTSLGALFLHVHGLMERVTRPRRSESSVGRGLFCSLVASRPTHERAAGFAAMSRVGSVASAGQFLNTFGGATLDVPHTTEPFWAFLGGYRFNLCFENARVDNYVTEKIFNAYLGGSVPVYWGAPQALELFNLEAIVHVEDASDVEGLAARVAVLEADPDAYRRVFEQPLFRDGVVPAGFTIDGMRALCRDRLNIGAPA